MDRLTLKIGKVAVVLAPIFLILPFALAEDAKYVGEDYYGNDINAAVLEANQNKRQLNYNRQHWYNRTTSKSFELDQFNSQLLTETKECLSQQWIRSLQSPLHYLSAPMV